MSACQSSWRQRVVRDWTASQYRRLAQCQKEKIQLPASCPRKSLTGPVAYLLNASDLRPIDQDNIVFKYADDTYLIVPDSNIQTIPMEMQHISEWAVRHNLKFNES